MDKSRLSPKLDGSSWESRMPFDLLVAYEDMATRDRALHLSQHLSKQLAEDYDFRCSWWKFEHLSNDILHEQAASAAVEANMVVLAVRARASFPGDRAKWLQSWLPRRGSRKAALVALLAVPSTGSATELNQTTEYLRALAKSAKLDFFSHSFELPQALPELPTVPPDDSPEIPAPLLEQQQTHFKMPIPRWGINE